jgi:hypothetical protein
MRLCSDSNFLFIFYFDGGMMHEHTMLAWDEYDAKGIFLCRVCDVCAEIRLAKYRPEILSGYNQSDVDEPIEEQ